jgi:sulfite exporter TauE/SafE
MGLLPCGMIYAALLRSVAAASAGSGAVDMLAFGLGTAGPLFGLGVFSVTINRWFRLSGQRWAAAGVMLMGAVLIWRALSPVALHMHHMHQVH